MNWQDIVEANKLITTINIKGKEYAEVNQRVKAFRYLYPDGFIDTQDGTREFTVTRFNKNGEPIERRAYHCVATVYDGEGKKLAVGTAEEIEGSSQITATSFKEVAETSAIGRALGFLGLGIDSSIASYEEVNNAISQQEMATKTATMKQVDKFRYAYSEEERKIIRQNFGVETDDDLPQDFVKRKIDERKDKVKEELKKRKERVESDPNYFAIDSEPLPFY